MVGIFTGAGTNLDRGSAAVLGARGQIGQTGMGQSGGSISVNAATGALIHSRNDEILIGRGPDQTPGLFYDSGPQGWLPGWVRALTGFTGVTNTAGSTVTLIRNSDRPVFTYDTERGAYVSKEGAGAYDEIRYSNGVWSYLDGDSQVTDYFGYQAGGILRLRTVDRDGNEQQYIYEGATGKVARIVNADGSYTAMTYTAGGRPNEIATYATAGGAPITRVRYGWDSLNRLVSTTIDLTPEDNSIADGKSYVTDYTYEGDSKRIKTISQTDGSFLEITYDASGRVVTLSERISAGVNRNTTLAYQAGYTTITDAQLGVTRLDYDAKGQLTKVTQPPAATGAAPQVTEFEYNANGDVTRVTDALGNATVYTHDSRGNVLTETDRLGNTVWRSYGASNELLRETRRGSDSAAAGAFHTTRYVYDSERHLRYVIGPKGEVTEYRYTAAGDLDSTIEYPEYSFGTSDLGTQIAKASFEAPDLGSSWQYGPLVAGMTFTGRAGIAGNNSEWGFAAAPDGDQVGVLQSYQGEHGTIEQSLSGLVAGRRYDVRFLLAARPIHGGGAPIRVALDGVELGTFYPASTAFREFTAVFTATGSTSSLTFTSAGGTVDSATALDNVRIVEPPVSDVLNAAASFEAPDLGNVFSSYAYEPAIAGMTFEGYSGIAANNSAWGFTAAPDGDQVAFVQRHNGLNGSMSQSLSGLVAGRRYDVKFLLAARPIEGGGTPITVAFNGTVLGTYNPASSAFQEFTAVFVATGSGGTLTFTNQTATTNGATAIDKIRVSGPPALDMPVASASYEAPDLGNALMSFTYDPVIEGMTFEGYSGIAAYDSAWGFVAAPDGDQVAFVQRYNGANGTTSQTVSGLVAGRRYDVKFLLAARPIEGGGTPVTVSFNGTVLGTYDPASSAFQEFTAAFTATGSSGTLIFSNQTATTDGATAIDKVRVIASPVADVATAEASYEAPEMGSSWEFNPVVSGMTFSGRSAIAGNDSAWGFANAPSGDQVAVVQTYLGAQGSITQSLSGLAAGRRYDVRVLLAARPIHGGGTPVKVAVDGVTIATFHPASTAYQEFTAVFTATGSTANLTFTSAGTMNDGATAIDNVRVLALQSEADLSEAQVDAWRDALPDRSSTKVTKYSYDVRGNLLSTSRYSTTSAAGTITAAEAAQDYSSTAYAYDQAGQLLSRTTLGQASETFVYDGLGRVIRTTDRHSGLTEILFDDAFNRTVVTLANGYVKTSTYDKTGNLISAAESGSYIPGTPTTLNKYDKLGRLRMTTDATGFSKYFVYDKVGRLTAEVNHRGDMIEYRYDANDRLVATGRLDRPVSTGNLLALANPDSTIEMSELRPAWALKDLWTWTTYDKEGRVSSTIDGTIRTYEYDASGRLVKTVAYYNGFSWEQLLAFQNNPPTVPYIPTADDRDTVTRTFYDSEGRLAGTLDAEGYLTHNQYDLAGQLIRRTAYFNRTQASFRANGTLEALLANQAVSASDRFTHYAYDRQGLLRYEIDAHDQVVEHGYDGARQLISTVRYAGSIAATADYSFDRIKALVAASGLAASPDTRRSFNVYHQSGDLAFAIDGEGGVAGFDYDNMGQVKKTVRFAAVYPTTTAPGLAAMQSWAQGQAGNAGNRVTRHYYSDRGEQRFAVDEEGYLVRTDYDPAGRMTGQFSWDTPVAVNDFTTIENVDGLQAGTWTGRTYSYSYGGELTDAYNGEGNRTHYDYYSNGALEREYVVLPDSSYTNYDYDNFGRVVVRTDGFASADQSAVRYERDGLGNLQKVTDGRSKSTITTYDKLGRVLSETDPLSGIVRYEYNAFGEVTKVTDARGSETIHGYDRLGRLETTTDALNVVTTHGYNAFGDLRTVTRGAATTELRYDRAGRVKKSIDAEGHYEDYTLNAFGERLQIRNKLGGVIENSYDRRGLLTHETLPMASSNVDGVAVATTVTNKFEYDARGNLRKKIEALNLAEVRTTYYDYDKADRLIETRGDAVWVMNSDWVNFSVATPTERLRYDNAGRVILKTNALGGSTFYFYDMLDRVKVELATAGGSTSTYIAYTYDANGNVLTRRVYDGTVGTPGGTGDPPPLPPAGGYRETRYEYDALNRLEKTVVAGVRTGAWNGTAYATTASADLVTRFEYDANGNLVRTEDGNGVSSYSYYDKQNRKVAQVDREGYLAFYTLDAEGNVLQEDRYASRVAASIASNPADLRTAAANADAAAGLARRTTLFTYDKNGRRITEQRLDVNAVKLDPVGHNVVADAAHSLVQYSYNELGQVSLKTEANGDFVDYTYDLAGRLIQETRSPYADHNNVAVNPTVRYFYNGLNELTLARQGGAVPAAGDRMTRYTYGNGGRMATMVDANGATYSYYYDVAGNVMRESYSRYKADSSFTIDSLLYTRDLLGRVTSQGLASWTGSEWKHGDRQGTAYNAHGDVAQRGLNGAWQEQLSYDSAGRLWKSNSGDGVWRYFVHDAAGNQTLALETEETELTSYALDTAIAHGTAGSGGINATIAVFDKRGQQIQTVMPWRERNATTRETLSSSRSYNAFGETTSETDVLNKTTNFTYNTMGRLIQKQSPTVAYTNEGGATLSARPTEKYHYDVSGRMIASDVYTDSVNFNRVRRDLLAGTGHGGSEAIVTHEYHGDDGYLRNAYDVFGDKRVSWDEINRRTDLSYDAMGRLTQMSRPNGLVDHYAYDLLGQRTKHWNSLLGAGNVESTDYDMQGRVTRQVAFGGDVTQTVYDWQSTHATDGMGTFGGWTETTTMANGRSSTEKTDAFGRQIYKSDLGGHVHEFSYDKAGRLAARTGADPLSFIWLNTGKLSESYAMTGTVASGTWSRKGTVFGYDNAGQLVSEKLVDEGQTSYYGWSHTYKNASASYDDAGRLIAWEETGSVDMARARTSYQYDLAGNVRHTAAVYRYIDHQGVESPFDANQETWYRYDSLNRMVTKGDLVDGQIVRGSTGVDYLYDKAGQRVSAFHTVAAEAHIANPWYDPQDPYSGGPNLTVPYGQTRREDYSFDAGGFLWQVRIAENGYTDNQDGTVTPTALPATGLLRATYTNDLMGRVTRQEDFQGNGVNAVYDRSSQYDGKGNVWCETIVQKQGNDTLVTATTHDFGSGADYALGAVTYSTSNTYKRVSGVDYWQYSSTATTGYSWYESAVQSSISTTNSAHPSTYTSFTHDGSGNLVSVSVSDGVRPRSVTFVNDAAGQAIKRDEADGNVYYSYLNNYYSSGDPHDVWHRFGGKQMGHVGNNGTLDSDYATSIANRSIATAPGQGAFRYGAAIGSVHGDFDLSGDGYTSYDQGVDAGGYTVRQGDTLESIAAQLWGDSALWYKLAEANGLSSSAGLAEGRRLVIPAGAIRSHHNASTFKPYDPAETIGDLSPATAATAQPKAGKRGKCGVFGVILLVAIAVAVTVVTSGAAVAALSSAGSIGAGIGSFVAGTAGFTTMVAAGAIGSAVGSIASQAFGVATGIQDKFSWKAVAMAGISGGVGGGLGAAFPASGLGTLSTIGRGAALGAAGSALTQGIGVAVGLQKKFDFAGVAAAGLAGGASAGVGKVLQVGALSNLSARNIGANLATSAAGAIAGAAGRSLVNGSDFGDNLLAALPDVIGSTLGNMIAWTVAGRPTRAAVPKNVNNHKAMHGTHLNSAALVAPGATDAGTFNYITDPIDLGPVDFGPYLSFYGGTGSGSGTASDQTYDIGDIVITGPRRGTSVPLNVPSTFERSISTERYRTETRLFPTDAQTRFRRFAREHPGLTGGQARRFVMGLAKEFGIDASLGGLADWNAWAQTHRRGTADYTLRYEVQVENSAYSQFAGSFLTSPAGTATLHYLDDASFGLVSLLDSNGALDLTARQNPRSAQVGANIGIVVSVFEGGFGLTSAAGRRTIGTGGPQIVYRGLSEADAMALRAGDGLTAKAPGGTWTAAEHVANAGPGRGGAAANSPWISTSRRLDVANAFDSGHGVVAIDLNKVDSLQVEVWRTAPRLNGQQGLPYHRSIWGQEVTIKGSIPRDAIIWQR